MNTSRSTPLQLSVIVPLAPDESAWPGLLAQLQALPSRSEIIVVHAGAVPDTIDAAIKRTPVQHVSSLAGRARQQNAGARTAAGRWLWFLHADSRLLEATLPALVRFSDRPDDALGWFDLKYASDGPRLTAVNAWGANLRSRHLGLPFGDQGLLLPAARFAALGGFDERARYGEDHLLVWAAHQAGLPVTAVGAPLRTSGRKYASQGWLRTTAQHLWLTALQAWPAWRAMRRDR